MKGQQRNRGPGAPVGRACPGPPSAGTGVPALHKRRHLRRLERIFDPSRAPLFLLTVCVQHREPVLANTTVFRILLSAWRDAAALHGWIVGRYVAMPDHVHFFAAPSSDAAKDLSGFVGGWKRWTAPQIRWCGFQPFAWQPEFFDHLMRSSESYAERWEYVRCNPVRAGLVSKPDDWPYQGEIHILRW